MVVVWEVGWMGEGGWMAVGGWVDGWMDTIRQAGRQADGGAHHAKQSKAHQFTSALAMRREEDGVSIFLS